MFKNLKILNSYYKFSGLKWKYVIIEFLILLIPSLLSIISPILTANIISSLTVYDFKKAVTLLSYDFCIILITALLYFIYHFFNNKITKIILHNTNEYIYETIKNNKYIDKVNSSTMNDIWNFAKFNNSFLYKICFLIKSIIIIVIIFRYNIIIALSIISISIISAFFFDLTNKNIKNNNLLLTDLKTKSLEMFNNIQKGVGLDSNQYMENTMKYKYLDNVDFSIKTNNKISLYYSLNNNFITLILKTAVFLFTFYLITLVKSTYLSLSSFLILTPYLTSSAQNLIAFFEVFPEIGLIDNTINEFKKLSQENNITDSKLINHEKTPTFFDVRFFHTELTHENYSIFDVNLEIKYKEIVEFIGKENCGKRAICELLSKKENTSSGSVFIGEININNLSIENYNKIIFTTYKIPFFYNISIIDNMLIVCKNKTKIFRSIKELKIENLINSLKLKTDTIIDDKINQKCVFYLGILRAYLLNPKIICIYEIPDNFDNNDYLLFSDIIKILNKNSTIIIFSHKIIDKISADKIYLVENSSIKINNKNNV